MIYLSQCEANSISDVVICFNFIYSNEGKAEPDGHMFLTYLTIIYSHSSENNAITEGCSQNRCLN